ncbi:hypothetical protein [Tabrizicola flagellatus]|uniref:hypothetical protein n=1 Tax=Tabrizicola flagellatus TaxID=2593021 RepID=UPI0011F0DB2B|nr:hypothetical protein [Tabrizicola flagellatus]
MIAFAYIDAEGRPIRGGVLPALPSGAVPLPAPFTTADLPRLAYRDGVWVWREEAKQPVVPTREELEAQAAAVLELARRDARRRINERIGALRSRIYTDIPGQDALYLEKRAEALAYVREAEMSGEPKDLADYPLIAGEVGITAPTAWQLAQIWLHLSDRFKAAGAATETARMRAMVAIETAPDLTTLEGIEIEIARSLADITL